MNENEVRGRISLARMALVGLIHTLTKQQHNLEAALVVQPGPGSASVRAVAQDVSAALDKQRATTHEIAELLDIDGAEAIVGGV